MAACLINIFSLAYLADRVSEDTTDTIFATWGAALSETIPSPTFTILELHEELDQIKFTYLLALGFLNIAALVVLILFISKIALEPTRDAINAQRNFIGYTAHELRTPLSIARTNIEATLLSRETITKEECLTELAQTMNELDSLAGIINNLVTLNTLSNFVPSEYHHYDVHELIHEVTASFSETAAQKKVTMRTDSTPGLIVWANKNAIKQMIGNVVANAISYSNQGGNILVRAYPISQRYVRIMISDYGVGIAKDDLPYIFKPFYRSALIQNRKEGGSGLGLSIVRELVRLHLGRVSVQSAIGEGTTVTIDLPVFKHRAKNASDRSKQLSGHEVVYNFARGGE